MKPKPKKPPRVFAPLPCGATLLSLDVSSSACGWCVGKIKNDNHAEIVDFGVIKPTASWDSVRRTDCMVIRVAALVARYVPLEICMEFQGHQNTGKRIQGLAVLGQTQGSIRTYLSMTHKVTTISEREWTKLGGRNTKKEIRFEHIKNTVEAYAARLEENPRFDDGRDAADAIGVLLYRVLGSLES